MDYTMNLTVTGYTELGCGGTKTIYFVDDNRAVAVPNRVDGQSLIRIWDRIISDEITMTDYLESIGLLVLKLHHCTVVFDDNLKLPSYYSYPFASYANDGLYIIDTKNLRSTQWKDKSLFPLNVDRFDVNNWMPILELLLKDIDIIAKNKIILSSDSVNLAVVANGSKWHSGSNNLYEVRYFGFDFSSKHRELCIHSENNDEKYAMKWLLNRCIEYIVWEEFCPKAMAMAKEYTTLFEKISVTMFNKWIDIYNYQN